MRIEPCTKCGVIHLDHHPCPKPPPSEEVIVLRASVAELEAALERIIAGPYAGDFSSTVEVASEALRPKH